jgi:hypothetical protein
MDIPESWTRLRMGHTAISNMKDRYAGNPERATITIDEETYSLPLGTDKKLQRPENVLQIQHEYKPLNKPINPNVSFLSTIKDKDIVKDIKNTTSLVTQYLNGDAVIHDLLNYFKEYHTDDDDLKMELGLSISLPPALACSKMRNMFTEMLDSISQVFQYEYPTSDQTIEIYSLPDLVYGNWQGLLESTTKNKQKTYSSQEITLFDKDLKTSQKEQDVLNDEDNMDEENDDNSKESDNEAQESDNEAQENDNDKQKEENNIKTRKRNMYDDRHENQIKKVKPNDIMKSSSIVKGDVIIINCDDEEDPCTLHLPCQSAMVWISRVISFDAQTKIFKGAFYQNNQKDITLPLQLQRKQQSFELSLDTVAMHIPYSTGKAFKVNADIINKLENRIKGGD